MRSLKRDLFERRLWPLVAVIVAAIAAVPFLLPGGRSGSPIAPPPAASGASAPATPTTRHATTDTHRAATPTSRTRDPFQEAGVRTPTADHLTQSTTSTTTVSHASPATSSGGAGTSSAAGGSSATTPAPTTPATTTPPTTTAVVSAPPVTTTPTKPTTGNSGKRAPAPSRNWDIYAVDLQIGPLGSPMTHEDIARLTPLPNERAPQAMYMGVTDHGRRAVFALGAGVEVRAAGKGHAARAACVPSRVDCALVVIPAGGRVELLYVSSTGRQRMLALHVRRITTRLTRSASVAKTAREHVSAVGLCDLKLGDPIGFFDPAGESLKLPSIASCRHHKLAVPFPGSLGAGSSVRG